MGKQDNKTARATFLVRLEALVAEGREEGLDNKTIRKVLKDVRQRLRAGVPVERALRALTSIGHRLRTAHPPSADGFAAPAG